MIEINIRSSGNFKKLVKDLEYVSSETFLRSIDLSTEQNKTLRFLKSIFPRSSVPHNKKSRRYMGHLVDGWRVSPYIGRTFGFSVEHVWQGDPSVAVVLRSLDSGHRAFTLTGFGQHFYGKINGNSHWVTFAGKNWLSGGPPPRQVEIPAQAGVFYSARVYEYVTEQVFPAVVKKLRDKIQSRIDRGYGNS